MPQTLQQQLQELNIDIAELRSELKISQETMKSIIVFFHGDGDVQSIPTKIALINHKITSLREEVRAIKTARITVLTACITGILGFLSSIIVALFHFFKR